VSADTRTPEQIRADIERQRHELGEAVGRLRVEVAKATDWRAQIVAHQRQVLIGAAVAGFVIGGGLGIFGRRKRKR
jgi:hypothetical protein